MNIFFKSIIVKLKKELEIEHVEIVDNSHKHKKHKFFSPEKFHLHLKIKSSYLNEICKELAQFGDDILISVIDDFLNLSTPCDSCDSSYVLQKNESTDIKVINELSNIMFSMEYFTNFCKSYNYSDVCIIKISEDLIMLDFRIDKELGNMIFYLPSKLN